MDTPNLTFAQLPKTDRRGSELDPVENAIIRSVTLGDDEHGGLTAFLHLEFHCSGCGFGGYRLGLLSRSNLAKEGNYCAEFVVRCLNTVGATRWEDLAGKPVRVLHEGIGGTVIAIGHYLEDKWFCPRVEFAKES